jgi:hypothetical protein
VGGDRWSPSSRIKQKSRFRFWLVADEKHKPAGSDHSS